MPKMHLSRERPLHDEIVVRVVRHESGARLEVTQLWDASPEFALTLSSRTSREALLRLRAEIEEALRA